MLWNELLQNICYEYLLEQNTVDGEGILIDPSGWYSHSQNILFCWYIIRRANAIQIVQIAEVREQTYMYMYYYSQYAHDK